MHSLQARGRYGRCPVLALLPWAGARLGNILSGVPETYLSVAGPLGDVFEPRWAELQNATDENPSSTQVLNCLSPPSCWPTDSPPSREKDPCRSTRPYAAG